MPRIGTLSAKPSPFGRLNPNPDVPTPSMTSDSDAAFTGKYEGTRGIGAWLVDRFFDGVRGLLEPVVFPDASLTEIGCGAGFSTQRLRAWLPPDVDFSASDISNTLVEKAQQRNPGVPIVQQSVYSLGMDDKSKDLLVMMEVLEHLEHPDRALAELARVARRHVLISTPREPIWRALNMVRGKYVGSLGNTPGHIQHWSSSGLRRMVFPWFEVAAMRQPLPWTILLLTPRP